MEKRKLGRTGLEVTQLAYGAMEIRGRRIWDGRPVEDVQAERILNAVLDAGVNFIDTANDYGRSEEYIGRYISSRRDEYYLATKCGCHVVNKGDHDDTPHVWTRENLLRNIENSLSLMKTDYVDIWQMHNPTVEDVEQNDLLKVMEEVKAAGKARWISISSTLPHITTFIEWGVFDTFQIPYSCLEPEHHDAISAAGEAGAGVIIRGGIGKGGPEAEQLNRVNMDMWKKAKLDEFCSDMKPAELILRYTLSHPYYQTSIVGTLNPDHLAENLAVIQKGPLPPDVYDEIKQRVTNI